ncbi:pyridoxal-phosphate dependent enzyme [Reichenbachiella carrageenanivorans]|uniref:Pyridoxal-phosphate dependent enzyme n=1 Tax=Reichenbachiella carrageenanivorans TaxID=2979869 RepID=A0ABY6D3N9_9BACT|nr:pyridoxal-phosphate dependent enzyme [Reichenbachiella carrageenanivorans]UXX80772.1 pyridoxal-phosphate dependent enzyme [Reichenbachiella carrageenanivorans]
MFEVSSPTPIQALALPILEKKGVEVFVKREDQIDVEISGNKWRKLKYNLIEAKTHGYGHILTFGGAYSNHIAATAAACKRFGFQAIGLIRGDELNSQSNSTLQKAAADGMQLEFISRSQYQRRNDIEWLTELSTKHRAYIIPEGGSNPLAIQGVAELVDEITQDFDYLVCPVGTGGTLAGISSRLKKHQTALGISTLKGEKYLEELITNLVGRTSGWQLFHGYHFEGYAKFDSHLIKFINEFYQTTHIPLDPIYTGKMMYALIDMIKKDKFAPGTKIISLHTGGLQGIYGFNQQHNNLLKT